MGTKLIEVALPLDKINEAAAREKSIRHGHPSTLHLWWARRPLAAARAVLFASLVDDPSSPDYRWPDKSDRARSEEEIDAERKRLHDLIVELVQWENSNNEAVLGQARAEIMRATDGNPPPVLDPFAGGGSIPLEAQRLGLEAHASDLNPVAVLINKALIEIPPKFAGQPPVNPADRGKGMGATWKGAAGLAADVRYYGQWMRDEAERRIGHLYPKVQLPPEQGGGEAVVIAWIWARTITCPNPACGSLMPLTSSFWLSKKSSTWVVPHPDTKAKRVEFSVHKGKGQAPEAPKLGRGSQFYCLVCGQTASDEYVKQEGRTGRMGTQLMAIVAEGRRERVFLSPNTSHIAAADVAAPRDLLETQLPRRALGFSVQLYGVDHHRDLFTPRQLLALKTFSELVAEARTHVRADAIAGGMDPHEPGVAADGRGADAYADAIATYLAFAVDRLAESLSTVARWQSIGDKVAGTFSRQAIPMIWDFAEVNPFSGSTRNFGDAIDWVQKVLAGSPRGKAGSAKQDDAAVLANGGTGRMISTDPPYYDNIGYADLSDYFYVWLRLSLGATYPELFRTVLVPKNEELVANPFRFQGGRSEADRFFEGGLQGAFSRMRSIQHDEYPLTVYYAFRQMEEEETSKGSSASSSTGWETMLEGLVTAGYSITGTWPIRTERSGRTRDIDSNALASSIVLACRTRPDNAPTTTRNEFLRRLRRELPHDLKTMQQASIAPVDLAQAAIGPGMRIYSEYSGVLEAGGEKLRVRTALQLINQVLDETLTEQDSEHDRETGWAVAWFEQFGMSEGEYGRAETLATARAVSVEGLRQAGIVTAGRGKVQLIPRAQLTDDWNPERDRRLTDWEIVQHLIRTLETSGQPAAATLKQQLGSRAEIAKELAYRLYTICERKGWAQEALSYNGLVVNWPDITRLTAQQGGETVLQQGLV